MSNIDITDDSEIIKHAKANKWVEIGDDIVDPQFADAWVCEIPFDGKCDNSECGKEYNGYGTCLFCQKGKMQPVKP